MSQSQATSEEEPSPLLVLSAYTTDLRHFTNLLRGVSFEKRALFDLTAGGIVVTVEEARTLLAFAFIRNDIFDEYIYIPMEEPEPEPQSSQETVDEDEEPTPPRPKRTLFEVNLSTVIDCLNLFGTAGTSASAVKKHRFKGWNQSAQDSDGDDDGTEDGSASRRGRTSKSASGMNASASANTKIDQFMSGSTKGTALRMTYAGPGHPLVLHLAESSSGPAATCEIVTYDPEPALELPFDSDAMIMKMILKSSWLQDALSELHPSCDKLTIIGNPPPAPGRGPTLTAPPRLRIKATGTFGTTEMDYPNDKEVLESCECDTHVSFTYRTSHVVRVARALQHSTKTSVRIDEGGLLSLQLIIPSPRMRGPKAAEAFTEFRLL
ncbi:unnamed protein product [Somion occarium]|uniref:Rad1-domain-containing protein n=1 Tax=Somion occarium TaxID=3059160 RepID=A0ABP1D8K9_9APHY